MNDLTPNPFPSQQSNVNNWKDLDLSTPEGLRALDILTAQRAGYYIKHATLYMPSGTLIGGDIHAHMKQIELEDNTELWHSYSPRFTKHVDAALWLWSGVEGLSIATHWRSDGPALFEVSTWFGYRGFGDDHHVRYLSLNDVPLHLVIGWHKIMDCKVVHEKVRAERIASIKLRTVGGQS